MVLKELSKLRRSSPRLLMVKLADFGDALLMTPALKRLRDTMPDARIDVLTTRSGAPAFEQSGLVDALICFEKARYDKPSELLSRQNWRAPFDLAKQLRSNNYDAVLLLHRLSTRFGALKHTALCLSIAAPLRIGLRRPGYPRGAFLTHSAEDLGFDKMHAVELGLRVVDRYLELQADDVQALANEEVDPVRRPDGIDEGSTVVADDRASSSSRLPSSLSGAIPRPTFAVSDSARRTAKALLAPLLDSEDQGATRSSAEFNDASRTTSDASLHAISGRRSLIAVHPGSGEFSRARRWPASHFAALIDQLMDAGHRCVLVGRESDDIANVLAHCKSAPLDLSDRCSLEELAAVLATTDLCISNDSGVMHLSTAMNTPTLAIFGPSNERAWGPWWPAEAEQASPHRVISLDLSCRPCFYRGFERGEPQGCATRDCLQWLKPDHVADAALSMVGQRVPIGELE